VEQWKDKLIYLLIYTVEAHPKKPDPSPYQGVPWTMPFSEFRQPRNYSERLSNSQFIDKGLSKLKGNFTVLVDDLTPHNTSGGNDFVWCMYGPAPNAAFFIHPNKTVGLAQTWFSLINMNESIASYFNFNNKFPK
jgi:hypothetical protein